MRGLVVKELPWMRWAACRGMNQDIFFPAVGESAAPAKAICAACPCRTGCLQLALESGCDAGVFGGLTPKERVGMRRAQIQSVARCGSDAGYYRHLRGTLTDPCPSCRAAHRDASRGRNARRRTA